MDTSDVIKQSVTAGTESSQILIQSLQDCLHSIDEQAAMVKYKYGILTCRSFQAIRQTYDVDLFVAIKKISLFSTIINKTWFCSLMFVMHCHALYIMLVLYNNINF